MVHLLHRYMSDRRQSSLQINTRFTHESMMSDDSAVLLLLSSHLFTSLPFNILLMCAKQAQQHSPSVAVCFGGYVHLKHHRYIILVAGYHVGNMGKNPSEQEAGKSSSHLCKTVAQMSIFEPKCRRKATFMQKQAWELLFSSSGPI